MGKISFTLAISGTPKFRGLMGKASKELFKEGR
jgi:hypothetical protein